MCVMTAYLLSWCSVLNSLKFDMQHDYFQKKDIVLPFDPTPWVGGVFLGKIFATMLLPASSALI